MRACLFGLTGPPLAEESPSTIDHDMLAAEAESLRCFQQEALDSAQFETKLGEWALERNLQVHAVPPDGNCMLACVATKILLQGLVFAAGDEVQQVGVRVSPADQL